jgi:hypothetical protein
MLPMFLHRQDVNKVYIFITKSARSAKNLNAGVQCKPTKTHRPTIMLLCDTVNSVKVDCWRLDAYTWSQNIRRIWVTDHERHGVWIARCGEGRC